MNLSHLLLMMFSCSMAFAGPSNPVTKEMKEVAGQLRDQAIKGTKAFDIVESLTTEVGPRKAGSPGDRAAVLWAEAKLKELGFDKVWKEEVTFPNWIRGEATCEVLSPFPQPLLLTALGFSVGTPDEGISAEILKVADYETLLTLKPEQVKGKIVFINNRMVKMKDASGYGKAVVARGQGASEAANLGAVALLIRSIGTDSHRFPHTGTLRYKDEYPKIPAAALSNPDANLLEQMLRRGRPVTVNLKMTSRGGGMATSHNVIGEIHGRETPEEVVVLGAHLDSWDLGTGALDDGAGVAIVTEVARRIGQLKQRPRRTIRVVLFANEEAGLFGARAYAKEHYPEIDKHIIGTEADLGADKAWLFRPRVAEHAWPVMLEIGKLMEPLGIAMGKNNGYGGPDMGPLNYLGMPVATIQHDGTDYFDYHHTADDTLDKIKPENLDYLVASYAVFAYICAETPTQFRELEKTKVSNN